MAFTFVAWHSLSTKRPITQKTGNRKDVQKLFGCVNRNFQTTLKIVRKLLESQASNFYYVGRTENPFSRIGNHRSRFELGSSKTQGGLVEEKTKCATGIWLCAHVLYKNGNINQVKTHEEKLIEEVQKRLGQNALKGLLNDTDDSRGSVGNPPYFLYLLQSLKPDGLRALAESSVDRTAAGANMTPQEFRTKRG